ncbi:hypothetical protein JWV26_13785 [Ectopseudomonas toyotomiensis]|uniref:Aminoglycoside phosphotransferase domain-containing protein n=1 Tax=Ectopseudomonas toyotomiensis TaxID=554344 RepID=A0ABD7DRS9_9GAMM|nr:phosphotransferase [Pseudomonas toyotomiensis]QSL90847.1 hypothetical protein JWV26_13785 [Pseudomonas toyotomiensis]
MQRLSADQLQVLMHDSTVLEQDGLGPKVLRLLDGSYLKLFRKRRLFSSETLKPYAMRFSENARRLQRLGFSTPQIIAAYRVEDEVNGTAVHYVPLPGDTLRKTLEEAQPEQQRRLITQFGRLLGHLHEQGVYFRSIHLGNVLVLPNEALGLIDVADMKVGRRPLSLSMRLRNLKHMRRYEKDEHWLFGLYRDALSEGYGQYAPNFVQALLLRPD